ncbi:MAG: RDD family protein [Verrucomicrobiota bacterium]
MNWYYADAGRQVGPITDEQLDVLLQSGAIKADTLVWRDGMASWLPYGQVRSASVSSDPGVPPPMTGGIICVECGKSFQPDQVIRYGDRWVCASCKPIFVQKLQEGAQLPGGMEYAGFWIRFVAKFIDGLILAVPLVVLMFAFFFSGFRPGGRSTVPWTSVAMQLGVQLCYYALAGAYNIFFIGKYGATPGKMAVRIHVVTPEGGKISYARATGRFFAEILSGLICNIGYIIAAFDREKRALHDHICNTRVVKK